MKNKRAKSTSLLLAVTLMAVTLFGCSNNNGGAVNKPSDNAGTTNSGTEQKEVKLKVLHNWNGSSGSDTDTTAIEKVIKEKRGLRSSGNIQRAVKLRK